MFDIILRGGTVVTPHGVATQDLAIKEKQLKPSHVKYNSGQPGKRCVDTAGKIVVPGGIDAVHCKWHMPMPDGSVSYTEGPEVVSRAALYGGTTTMLDFAAGKKKSFKGCHQKRDEDWVDNCYCDYAYHLMLLGDIEPPVLKELEDLIPNGYCKNIYYKQTSVARDGWSTSVIFGRCLRL